MKRNSEARERGKKFCDKMFLYKSYFIYYVNHILLSHNKIL